MLKLYWQVGITLPLFQMAQGIRPFRDLGAVKRWPLCTAPRSQGVWGGTNIAFLKSPVNSNIVSEIIIIQQQKKLFCFASCSGYSHHQKLFRSHESGLSHNNLVSLRAFGQNHRRRRIYSLFSGTDEAATESLVNKRKFNSNTHMKSVNGFFFSRTFSHLFFLRWVENSVNQ